MLRDFINIDNLFNAAIDGSTARIRTEISTSLRAVGQAFSNRLATRRGVQSFYYLGPFDQKTRPFCTALISSRNQAIYTIEEIRTLDNGQGLDVFLNGGGYNCRHRWIPLDRIDNLDDTL